MSFIASLNEKLSLLIAATIISLVFGSDYLLKGNLLGFLIAAIASTIAVIPHELAHKWTAIRLGCSSRYVLSPTGALLTLITAIPFIPIKFIMPGYVVVASPYYDPEINKRIDGITSLSGPVVNIVVASVALLVLNLLIKFGVLSLTTGIIWLTYSIAAINSWVAFFNLLPVPPLDGSKVISWKPLLWVLSFAISIAMVLYTWLFLP